MISTADKETILTLHRAGNGIRQISRLLRISRNTVRRVIKGTHRSQIQRATRYEDLAPLVAEHFNFCKGNAVRIQQLLNEKYGYHIPYSSLSRLVRQLELREGKKKKRAGQYSFGPGREAQHDTSPHRLILGDKNITAQCASLTMGYCKKLFIQYYPQFTRFEAKVFLSRAFVYIGGTCARCIIDNTSVIIAQGSGAEAVIAPEMQIFARMFATRFIAHPVGDADRKGKVEKNFHYVENNFLAGRIFSSWSDLNEQARNWCDTVANKKPKRSLGRMSPEEVYVLEKPHLRPLPPHMAEVYKTLQRVVDMSGFVTVDTNRYSVPEKLCGEPVEVLKSWEKIIIYHKHRKVAEHDRLIDKKDGKVVAPGHHLPIYRHKRHKAACRQEKALLGRSQSLDRYVAQIKKRGRGWSKRRLQKLLELQRTYPADAFEKAVETALHYGLYELNRVENLVLSFVAGDFFNLKVDD